MNEQLIETWSINNRINIFFLRAVPADALWSKPPKGRAIGAQFAHIHNVRLMWLKSAAPELLVGLEKLEGEYDAETMCGHLEASGKAIATCLGQGLEEGRIKGFKPHPIAWLGYLISHESHHRGQAEILLRIMGHSIDDKTSFGIWEWGTR